MIGDLPKHPEFTARLAGQLREKLFERVTEMDNEEALTAIGLSIECIIEDAIRARINRMSVDEILNAL